MSQKTIKYNVNFQRRMKIGDQNSVDDNEMMKQDPIICLIFPAKILERISWCSGMLLKSLSNIKNVNESKTIIDLLTKCIPNLLISFTRHSNQLNHKIGKEMNLLRNLTLVTQTVNSNRSIRIISPELLKLLRLLMDNDPVIMNDLIQNLKIFSILRETLEELRMIQKVLCESQKFIVRFLCEFCKLLRVIFETLSDFDVEDLLNFLELINAELNDLMIDENCSHYDQVVADTNQMLVSICKRIIYERQFAKLSDSVLFFKSNLTKSEQRLKPLLNIDNSTEIDIDFMHKFLTDNPAWLISSHLEVIFYTKVMIMLLESSLDHKDMSTAYDTVVESISEYILCKPMVWSYKRFLTNQSLVMGVMENYFDISLEVCNDVPKEYLEFLHKEINELMPVKDESLIPPPEHEPSWSELSLSTRIDTQLTEKVELRPKNIPSLQLSCIYRHEHSRGSRLMAYYWPPAKSEDHYRCLFPIFAIINNLLQRTISAGCVNSKLTQAYLPLVKSVCSKKSMEQLGTTDKLDGGLLFSLESEIFLDLFTVLYNTGIFEPRQFTYFNLRLISSLNESHVRDATSFFSTVIRSINGNYELFDDDELIELYNKQECVDSKNQTTIYNSFTIEKPILFERLYPYDWPYQPMMRASVGVEKFVVLMKVINGMIPFKIDPKSRGVNVINHVLRLMLGISMSTECLGFKEAGESIKYFLDILCKQSAVSQSGDDLINEADIPKEILPSFYDIFVKYCEYFSSTSYGSDVLANLLLWPCRQGFHPKYRRSIWVEHKAALLSIRIHPNKLTFPLEDYLNQENDEVMIKAFLSGLLSGVISKEKHVFLYLWSLHHVNKFLYEVKNKDSQLIKSLFHVIRQYQGMTKNNDHIINDIKYYKRSVLKDCVRESGEDEPKNIIELYDNLPESRVKHFADLFPNPSKPIFKS